jgi:hypothetical protein
MASYLVQPQAVQLQYSLTQDPTHPGLRTECCRRHSSTSFLLRDYRCPHRYHPSRHRHHRHRRHRYRHRHRPCRRCRVRSPLRREDILVLSAIITI